MLRRRAVRGAGIRLLSQDNYTLARWVGGLLLFYCLYEGGVFKVVFVIFIVCWIFFKGSQKGDVWQDLGLEDSESWKGIPEGQKMKKML